MGKRNNSHGQGKPFLVGQFQGLDSEQEINRMKSHEIFYRTQWEDRQAAYWKEVNRRLEDVKSPLPKSDEGVIVRTEYGLFISRNGRWVPFKQSTVTRLAAPPSVPSEQSDP